MERPFRCFNVYFKYFRPEHEKCPEEYEGKPEAAIWTAERIIYEQGRAYYEKYNTPVWEGHSAREFVRAMVITIIGRHNPYNIDKIIAVYDYDPIKAAQELLERLGLSEK